MTAANYTLGELFAALGNPDQFTMHDVRRARVALRSELNYWRMRADLMPRAAHSRRIFVQQAMAARKHLRVVTAWLRVLNRFTSTETTYRTAVFHAARPCAVPGRSLATQRAGSPYPSRSLQ